jgi:tRNA threonylcarbamoyladenosine biosynthesis protein TsaE
MTDQPYEVVIDSPDLAATAALGATLASCLPGGTLVALEGPLGAGKTTLVKGVAEALGIDPASVTSPTFVLMQVYEGRRPLLHVDAFRLQRPEEFAALGAEEFFPPDGLVFVEWFSKAVLKAPDLEIHIEILHATGRKFVLRTRHAPLAERLRQALARLGARSSPVPHPR